MQGGHSGGLSVCPSRAVSGGPTERSTVGAKQNTSRQGAQGIWGTEVHPGSLECVAAPCCTCLPGQPWEGLKPRHVHRAKTMAGTWLTYSQAQVLRTLLQ